MSNQPSQHWYVDAQERKKWQIHGGTKPSVLDRRRSVRCFTGEIVDAEHVWELEEAVRLAPSSCNRQGVHLCVVRDSQDKHWLSEVLVGGRRWAYTADALILLFANPECYVVEAQLAYMPLLDIGHAAMAVQVRAVELGLGACYINPNTQGGELEQHPKWNPRKWIFGGAVAIGYAASVPTCPPKRTHQEVYYP